MNVINWKRSQTQIQNKHRHSLVQFVFSFSLIFQSSLSFVVQDTRSSSSRSELKSVKNTEWANHALLISSFSDGVIPSDEAMNFLKNGLLKSILTKEQHVSEKRVEDSVMASPCNGPDISALDTMEDIDNALTSLSDKPLDVSLDAVQNPTIRFVYIPTAMYALRSDSSNSPGKQRQRARADGKKRRTQVINLIDRLFENHHLQILTVTLDFDDGSIKQPQGSDHQQHFPKDATEALTSWNPHFIYVEGGNTFWLHHCIQKGNYANQLLDAVVGEGSAVYCGKSAGAIIAGDCVETGTWKEWDDPTLVPGMENYADWIGVKGLNLLGGDSIFPHMSDEYNDLVASKLPTLASKVHCLADNEVCCVQGDTKEVRVVTAKMPIKTETSV